MTRTQMIDIMANAYKRMAVTRPSPEDIMTVVLKAMEDAGIKPPALDAEKQQALMSVYYGGYTVNQWDEDFAKNKLVVATMMARREENEKRKAKREKK